MASKQIEFEAVVSVAQVNKLLADLRVNAEGAAKAINDAFGGTVTKKIVFEEVTDEAVYGYGTLTGYTESIEAGSIVSWEATL